jgi:hypothetical protein
MPGCIFEKTDTAECRIDNDVMMTLNPKLSATSQSAAVKILTATSRSSSSIAGRAGWSREGQSAERAGVGRERQDGNGKSAMQA